MKLETIKSAIEEEFRRPIELEETEGGWDGNTYFAKAGEEKVVAKIRERRNHFEEEVLAQLQEANLPYELPRITKQIKRGEEQITVYTFVKGSALEEKTEEEIEQAAEAMAEFHRRSRGLILLSKPPIKPYSPREAESFLKGLNLSREEMNRVCRGLERISKQELIHNDFCNGNILFKEGRLTGVIDFENAHLDRRAKDVANAVLWDCFDRKSGEIDEEKAKKFLERYEATFPLGEERRKIRDYMLIKLGIQKRFVPEEETNQKIEWVRKFEP